MTETRYVTDLSEVASLPQSTHSEVEMEDPEAYRLYRLCPCGECNGTGKLDRDEAAAYADKVGKKFVRDLPPGGKLRCPACRGEGRTLELVATAGSKEAVGVALVTLALEDEWDECPFGLMHRPEGETGKWLIKPWGPSPRNVSDAGRTLQSARRP